MAITQSSVFFYQQRGYVRHIKRFKKQADQLPPSLRNIMNSKTDKRKDDDTGGSISARLAELAVLGEESLDTFHPPGTASTTKRGGQRSLLSSGTRSSGVGNAYAFTDTRLNALRQITEGLIAELEEYLSRFLVANMKPILSGNIIFELHADWSDLTENVTYEEFPQWRTKQAMLLQTKPNQKKQLAIDDDGASVTSSTGDSRSNSRLGGLSQPLGSSSARISSDRGSKKHSADKAHRATFVPPRLDPISEEKNTKRNSVMSNNDNDVSSLILESRVEHQPQVQTQRTSIQFTGLTDPTQRRSFSQVVKKLSILKGPNNSTNNLNTNNISNSNLSQPNPSQQSVHTNLDASRITGNSSSLSGWAVTFNLSNALYEEKGWTTITERINQQPIDFQRRVQRCLTKSLNNMSV